MSQDQTRRFCKKRHGRRSLTRAKHAIVAVISAAGMAMLASCGSGPGTPAAQSGAPLQSAMAIQSSGALQITMSPALTIPFDPNISDYAFVSNPGSPVQVSVNAPTNTKVSVDGQPFRGLTSTASVNINPGQSFSFAVTSPGGTKTYFVRSLPADFPTWTTERTATPQAEYYAVAPNLPLTSSTPRNYIIISDGFGVPMWWFRGAGTPNDVKLLADGNMAWTSAPTGEERSLDGSLVRKVTAASSLGGVLDLHELLLLPNGDYVFIADVVRGPVDLSALGGSATATVIDNVIEETAPNGSLVFQWSAMDHIPPSETDPLFRPQFIQLPPPNDPYHMNSIEANGDGFVVSLRHLNAVIRIDKASGNIVWKLGGSARPESLAFARDTFGNFGGQHDARILTDGTLTVFDDGTLRGRSPRAVRFRVDPVAKTATFVEQVTDPDVPSSLCCGSARKLSGGDWVMSWGLNPVVTEANPAGKRAFRMTFQQPYFSYRAAPLAFGVLSRVALRKGMDAQFPR